VIEWTEAQYGIDRRSLWQTGHGGILTDGNFKPGGSPLYGTAVIRLTPNRTSDDRRCEDERSAAARVRVCPTPGPNLHRVRNTMLFGAQCLGRLNTECFLVLPAYSTRVRRMKPPNCLS
jgi:hypothetical protein